MSYSNQFVLLSSSLSLSLSAEAPTAALLLTLLYCFIIVDNDEKRISMAEEILKNCIAAMCTCTLFDTMEA